MDGPLHRRKGEMAAAARHRISGRLPGAPAEPALRRYREATRRLAGVMAAAEPRSRRRRGRAQLPGPPAFALALVAPFDQPARDHLRLNLGRAFEDVEDARVAQQPADLIFQSIAIAALDLQDRVGVRPGGPRGDKDT